jgi:hypothetical protein
VCSKCLFVVNTFGKRGTEGACAVFGEGGGGNVVPFVAHVHCASKLIHPNGWKRGSVAMVGEGGGVQKMSSTVP